MADPARRRATYEDVLRAPENMVAQLVDGQLDLQPRPRALHARCASVLGGLLEPEPLSLRRLLTDGARALAWGAGMALIVFPPFWLGWLYWWHPHQAFHPAPPPSFSQDVLGQLLVIALPEEAFYRGYLQTSFDDAFRGRVRVLGAELGPGILIASALFALGHIATEVHPNRLAVFFPALVFGWLRVRTRGIGAGMVFHALSNLLTAYLAHSYMLGR